MDTDIASYRRMLLDIGNKLSEVELSAMKFMCKDFIPARRLEDVSSALDLWQVLEEREKLSPNSTTFLRELILTTTDNRLDVIRILEQYNNGDLSSVYSAENGLTNRRNFDPDLSPDLEEAFDVIVDGIGRHWRKLARKLGLSPSEIEFCVEKYPRDLKEQIRESLLVWSREQGSLVSRHTLCSALSSCQMGMLALQIQQII